MVLVLVGTAGARGTPLVRTLPAVGYAHPAGGPANETINVSMTDAPAFSPRFLQAAPGQNVSIHLDNVGAQPHSFTLSSQSRVAFNRSGPPSQLNATLHAYPPTVNVSVAPGHAAWANFSIPTNASFDSFEFVSQVPYQFQAGMWGYLNVSSSLPPELLYTNTTNSYSFQPAALSVSPTSYPINLEVNVTNLGDLGHTFTLSAQANVTLTTVGYFHTHAPLTNFSVPVKTGHSKDGNFTVSGPGVYEFVCTVQGHFANGMYGFLYVGVPVPAAAAAPSTAIVDTYVLAGSAVLVGIGVLLVVAGAFTGRLPSEPPSGHGGH